MFKPEQYEVNEAWIAFQLNTTAVETQEDGNFNFIALMDAHSHFMLSTTLIPTASPDVVPMQAKKLLNDARAHKEEQALTLIVANDSPFENLIKEATRRKMTILRVSGAQLDQFLEEEREIFNDEFGQKLE